MNNNSIAQQKNKQIQVLGRIYFIMNKFLFTLLFISIFTSSCRQMGKEGAELLSNKATSKAISRSISKVESEAEVLASKAGKTESKIAPNNLGRDEFLVAKQLEDKWIAKCKNIAKQQVMVLPNLLCQNTAKFSIYRIKNTT